MEKKIKIFFLLFISCAIRFYAQSTEEQLALQAFEAKEYDKALVYYDKLYDKNPLKFYKKYFDCLMALKEYKKAEKSAKRQIKNAPDALDVYLDLGAVYLADGNDKKKAEEQYEKAIKQLQDINQVYLIAQSFR